MYPPCLQGLPLRREGITLTAVSPVRMVMFPEENHALTRTGKLHNQIRHLSELVGWFEKYLKKEDEAHG